MGRLPSKQLSACAVCWQVTCSSRTETTGGQFLDSACCICDVRFLDHVGDNNAVHAYTSGPDSPADLWLGSAACYLTALVYCSPFVLDAYDGSACLSAYMMFWLTCFVCLLCLPANLNSTAAPAAPVKAPQVAHSTLTGLS